MENIITYDFDAESNYWRFKASNIANDSVPMVIRTEKTKKVLSLKLEAKIRKG